MNEMNCMNEPKKIGIVGAGWLGLPLAEHFRLKGYKVFATTTNEEKKTRLTELGIQSALYSEDTSAPSWFNELDWCVVNFPPRKSSDYSKQVKNLIQLLPSSCKLIFTSSTGVYPQESGMVTEETEVDQHHVVSLAEKVIQHANREWYILRLAGLVGPDRNPVHFLSGREVSNGQHPINLVDQQDCIQAISVLVESNLSSQVFNVAYPNHPSKEKYYIQKAETVGLVPPVFSHGDSQGKTIDGSKITRLTSFNYNYKP
jgi:nucleoside-diphosphate-sugar epimerase